MAGAINAEVTLDIVKVCSSCLNLCFSLPMNQQHIPSKVLTIWDGWSTRKWQLFTSFSISFIDLPPDNDTQWVLKNYLLEFNSPVGRHTGKLIGRDLVNTTRKFKLEKKVSTKGFKILPTISNSLHSWAGWLEMGLVWMMLQYGRCAKLLIQLESASDLSKSASCEFSGRYLQSKLSHTWADVLITQCIVQPFISLRLLAFHHRW